MRFFASRYTILPTISNYLVFLVTKRKQVYWYKNVDPNVRLMETYLQDYCQRYDLVLQCCFFVLENAKSYIMPKDTCVKLLARQSIGDFTSHASVIFVKCHHLRVSIKNTDVRGRMHQIVLLLLIGMIFEY
jgi:hypothetical protein